jgi:hypothetical protein
MLFALLKDPPGNGVLMEIMPRVGGLRHGKRIWASAYLRCPKRDGWRNTFVKCMHSVALFAVYLLTSQELRIQVLSVLAAFSVPLRQRLDSCGQPPKTGYSIHHRP